MFLFTYTSELQLPLRYWRNMPIYLLCRKNMEQRKVALSLWVPPIRPSRLHLADSLGHGRSWKVSSILRTGPSDLSQLTCDSVSKRFQSDAVVSLGSPRRQAAVTLLQCIKMAMLWIIEHHDLLKAVILLQLLLYHLKTAFLCSTLSCHSIGSSPGLAKV